MVRPIAHRGFWWPRRELQNYPASVLAALSSGFGAEVDVWAVRDTRLVVKHDEFSAAHELMLPIVDSSMAPLFLHVKGENDGFPERLINAVRTLGWLDSTYIFCSPSNDAMLARMKAASITVKTLVTAENLNGLDVLLDLSDPLGGADGVWLEQPGEDWVTEGVIQILHDAGKSAWIISPELHGRKLNLGMLMAAWQTADGLCTDYPHLVQRVLDDTDPVVHPKEPWWD